MKKLVEKPPAAIVPVPSLIVTGRSQDGRNNAFAVGFAANVSGTPMMTAIAVLPANLSYGIIESTGEFVINVAGPDQLDLYYYVGSVSGRSVDKFAEKSLAWTEGTRVHAPLLDACPMSVECRVCNTMPTGDHVLFIGAVEAVHCTEKWLGPDDTLDLSKIVTLSGRMPV